MYCFEDKDPTVLYYEVRKKVLEEGDIVRPRGKEIREIRPVAITFKNPLQHVTFLGGRKINPFFQQAEALWILSGSADAVWLSKFNKNMINFSDNYKTFNASYGERIRNWGVNSPTNMILCPLDQLKDVYRILCNDPDTRQAKIIISNPHFDNSYYLIDKKGKDIACNLAITFKIRHNKLHMVVFNRSNDVHNGIFGANLMQFSTIQEILWQWLKQSDNEDLKNLQVGYYTQITDSLHIYTQDYGSNKQEKLIDDWYSSHSEATLYFSDFVMENEPHMTLSYEKFENTIDLFWRYINPALMNDEFVLRGDSYSWLSETLEELQNNGLIDTYWAAVIRSMWVYRSVRLGEVPSALEMMRDLPDSQIKISQLYFLKGFIKKLSQETFDSCVHTYQGLVDSLCQSLKCLPSVENTADLYITNKDYLRRYLALAEN